MAVIVMMVGSRPLGNFVNHHPTVKVLALSFLILIGVVLVAEGLGRHIPKSYIYFAIAFAIGVEAVNLRVRAVAERRRASAPPPSG
jgi:predicted tellurium resistance membrane protein TerC